MMNANETFLFKDGTPNAYRAGRGWFSPACLGNPEPTLF
jgi:hypothetical protein